MGCWVNRFVTGSRFNRCKIQTYSVFSKQKYFYILSFIMSFMTNHGITLLCTLMLWMITMETLHTPLQTTSQPSPSDSPAKNCPCSFSTVDFRKLLTSFILRAIVKLVFRLNFFLPCCTLEPTRTGVFRFTIFFKKEWWQWGTKRGKKSQFRKDLGS